LLLLLMRYPLVVSEKAPLLLLLLVMLEAPLPWEAVNQVQIR